MADWISWDEAVEVVALHFPIERAEWLLHSAIQDGDKVKVWAADEGGFYLAGSPGYQYFDAEPDRLAGPDNRRHYRKINYVDLRSLKLWLKVLTSEAEATTAAAPQPEESRNALPQATGTEQLDQADDEDIYKSGAPGRPTSAHLVNEELQRRAAAGELCGTLASEAEHLSQWLAREHPKAPRMTPKTISNSCRNAFRSARKQRPK